VAAGAATGLACLVPRLRAVLGLVAVAGVVAAGVYTAAHQAAVHAPVNGSWPLYFGTASKLAWVGVVFLGADAVVGIILGRRRPGRRRRDPASSTSEDPASPSASASPEPAATSVPGDAP
jgi:hypothetical protein